MDIENTKRLIAETINQPELILQVSQTSQQVSVIINRPSHLEVNYEQLSSKMLEVLWESWTPEELANIEVVKFYGRIKGQSKLEWQNFQNLKQKKALTNPAPAKKLQTTATNRVAIADTRDEASSFWKLLNDFKFGQILITFKDIINTSALVGIFLILLTNLLAGQKPQSVSWEYKIEAIPDLIFSESMDTFGKSGWELVTARRAVNDGTASYECIFKRLKK